MKKKMLELIWEINSELRSCIEMINWEWTELDQLEKDENWHAAKALLLGTWKKYPHDLKVTLRLVFFCWYLIIEDGPVNVKNMDLEELQTVLDEVTLFGLTNYNTDPAYLWCFGYMMSLFPYYFGDDFEMLEEKGKSMLKQVYTKVPNDPVYKYSYLACISKKVSSEVTLQLQAILEDRFKGEGLLSSYFKSIWGNPHELANEI
ncbi:hypothetical protein [Bacillus sp. B1-b2]|uniref:hypothetical protein n=1 Tax=Bacillus sp. B1-b2 TaxID=2653201 RepID=UPI001D002997|nr:hypothetical protein [Bacillus sp. B1-b2]